MRLYRVFPWDTNAAEDQPGGALFVPTSATGRFDNPKLYRGIYCATAPEGAVGERFGYFARWKKDLFTQGPFPLALGTIDAPDLQLADLNCVTTLASLDVEHVVDVLTRDRSISQPVAARVYESGGLDGLSWWSAFLADWTNVLVWGNCDRLNLVGDPQPLSLGYSAVIAAAAALPRSLQRR